VLLSLIGRKVLGTVYPVDARGQCGEQRISDGQQAHAEFAVLRGSPDISLKKDDSLSRQYNSLDCGQVQDTLVPDDIVDGPAQAGRSVEAGER